MGFIILSLILIRPGSTQPAGPSDIAQSGLAFITSLAVHESAHALVAQELGNAQDLSVQFFTKKNNSFTLGITEVKNLNQDSKVPFVRG